jgi:serine/threonine protein kinase
LETTQGTALYYAPEIVRTGIPDKKVYGRKIDIWAIGVTLYYLATGVHPFAATNIFMYQKKVLEQEVDYSIFNSRDASLV